MYEWDKSQPWTGHGLGHQEPNIGPILIPVFQAHGISRISKTAVGVGDYIATGVNLVLNHPEYYHDYHLWIYEWDKSQPWKRPPVPGCPADRRTGRGWSQNRAHPPAR